MVFLVFFAALQGASSHGIDIFNSNRKTVVQYSRAVDV